MKVELLDTFVEQLNDQFDYIARDKPSAARKFKNEIRDQVMKLSENPMLHRRSIYYEDENHRDMVFKGYKVIFKIDEPKDTVFVIGLVNMQKGMK
jgi:plasmid stabilization system protein ParE